jgi:hypothetical protein
VEKWWISTLVTLPYRSSRTQVMTELVAYYPGIHGDGLRHDKPA